jgi:hypothetical protein
MPIPEPPAPPQKKRGCFFYGCVTSLILLAVILLGMFLIGRYLISSANRMVTEYTDTSPVALPKTEMSPEQLKQLEARVEAFSRAMGAHSNTAPLILTGPEVNALLASDTDLQAFKDKFFVSFEGEETKAQISLPLDGIPIPMLDLKGRYLNGNGTFKLAVSNGLLSVAVDSLSAKGKPLPAAFLASLQRQNLAQGFNSGSNAASLTMFQSVQVKDGALIVVPK